jgi:hypothetical protein
MDRYLAFLISYAFAGTLIGLLAARKNRSGWGWGLFGGLFLLPGLLVLMFMSFVCPKCGQSLTNQEWKQRSCRRCGAI